MIGLVVHVPLATQSTLFCGCSTSFGAEPNPQTCPVCIGMPGTLPVMNREAFQRLVDEDMAWLLAQPRSLERDHIEAILKAIPDYVYDPHKMISLHAQPSSQ